VSDQLTLFCGGLLRLGRGGGGECGDGRCIDAEGYRVLGLISLLIVFSWDFSTWAF
jgi:hypothetical protein